MKVKFFEKRVVVRPGAGKTVYKGIMDIDKNLAEQWEKSGYLEIVDKVKSEPKSEETVKPKRTYKKKIDVDEKVKQDG